MKKYEMSSELRIMLFSTTLFALVLGSINAQYTPDWKSIDSRPLPTWFDEAKFGIFIHWGVFSVPSTGAAEWFVQAWKTGDPYTVDFMKRNYPPDFTYADFAALFKAEFYDPNRWADLFQKSGARYVVFTAKHCEGFTNWPSNVSFNWNSMDVGPKRDIVGELAEAVRSRTKLHFGLYHCMLDWFHPLYMADMASGWKTRKFPPAKALPELYELVNSYKPELIWSDGAWEAPSSYWNSTNFLAWLYNESPVKDYVLVNDRWGYDTETPCHHGGYWTCMDHFNPRVLMKHKWENCMKIEKYGWGYRREAVLSDYITMDELLDQLVSTISCGGNLLLNVGPTSDGRILPIFEERLTQIGEWLAVNGEAIYASKPWTAQNDSVTPTVWYTSQISGSVTYVYAILLRWPAGGVLTLGSVKHPSPSMTVNMLGYAGSFSWKQRPVGGIDVIIPAIPEINMPCRWAWVLKLSNI